MEQVEKDLTSSSLTMASLPKIRAEIQFLRLNRLGCQENMPNMDISHFIGGERQVQSRVSS
jgi:hypothetical protein